MYQGDVWTIKCENYQWNVTSINTNKSESLINYVKIFIQKYFIHKWTCKQVHTLRYIDVRYKSQHESFHTKYELPVKSTCRFT